MSVLEGEDGVGVGVMVLGFLYGGKVKLFSVNLVVPAPSSIVTLV